MTRDANQDGETKLVQVGNYKFTGKTLGKGSSAVVKEAIHTVLRKKVSVKMFNLQKCNTYILKNLMREASILQMLDHPNVVKLFETMEHDHIYFMVTEVVRGGDLCSYVQHLNGKMKEDMIRRFSRQIALALKYLHSKGIVHRDLKLENVMLDSAKENIKLIDFGLSNTWSSDSPLKTLCGSPEYCAPELFVHGHKYGPEVDMWALGVIMYAMAAGRLPFPCLSSVMKIPEKKSQFLKIVSNGLAESQTRFVKGYAPEFIVLVKKLMNPNVEERLTIEDVFKDKWMTNNEHWAEVVYNTLDAYDLNNVYRQVCTKLKMSTERLKSELMSKPFGESGGFYNIMVYDKIHSRISMRSESASLSTECLKSMKPSYVEALTKKRAMPHNVGKETPNKISVIGTPQKINGVTRQSSYSKSSSISSGSTTTTPESGLIDYNSEHNYHLKMGGRWVSTPKIESIKSYKAIKGSYVGYLLRNEPRTAEKGVQTKSTARRTLTAEREPLRTDLKNFKSNLTLSLR